MTSSDVTIVHLSDLHFSSQHQQYFRPLISHLLDDIAEQTLRLDSEQCFVVFSGDLVKSGGDATAFARVQSEFVSKLLTALNLQPSNLMIVPGNHDIDPDKINSIYETGLLATLKDPDSVNQVLDKHSIDNDVLGRLTAYDAFSSDLRSSAHRAGDSIAHVALALDGRLGIALLNTAWRCTGKPADYDRCRLFVGENQLVATVAELRSAEFRIAVMHHPLDWLHPSETEPLREALLNNFDLVLCGHNHSRDATQATSSLGSTLFCNAGCLYEHTGRRNGYSLLQLSLASRQVTCYHRKYYRKRELFDHDLDVAGTDGQLFKLHPRREAEHELSQLRQELALAIKTRGNEQLLSGILSDSAPQSLEEIFVAPPLSRMREEEGVLLEQSMERSARDDRLHLDDLALKQDHLIFVGAKESGKTTLLRYLALVLTRTRSGGEPQLPILLDAREIRGGRTAILDALKKHLRRLGKRTDIDAALVAGRFVLLLDDVGPNERRLISSLNDFAAKQLATRLILTMSERPADSATVREFLKALTFKLDPVFIGPFGASQTRALIERWFGKAGVDVEKLIDRSLESIAKSSSPDTCRCVMAALCIRGRTGFRSRQRRSYTREGGRAFARQDPWRPSRSRPRLSQPRAFSVTTRCEHGYAERHGDDSLGR